MSREKVEIVRINDSKNANSRNNNLKNFLNTTLAGLVIWWWFFLGQNHKKISFPISNVEKKDWWDTQNPILLDDEQQKNKRISFYTKKINILHTKLDSTNLSKANLVEFLKNLNRLKQNYKFLAQDSSDEKIENYIFQKQKLLKDFENNLLMQEKKLDARAQKIIFSLETQSQFDWSKWINSDIKVSKKSDFLSQQKNIFQKRVSELEYILKQKSQLQNSLKILGHKNFNNFDATKTIITLSNKYLVLESNLQNQKQIEQMLTNPQAQTPPVVVKSSWTNNFVPPKQTQVYTSSADISTSSQTLNQTNIKEPIKSNVWELNKRKNSTQTYIQPVSKENNFQKLFVVCQPWDWVFQLLRKQNIQPTNQLVKEFEKINWKNLVVWKKYIIPDYWKKKYPLKDQIVKQNVLETSTNQKQLIFRALNFLAKNNIKIPDYITWNYILALWKKQWVENIYKNFSLDDKTRIKNFSKNLDFSPLDNQSSQYAKLIILLSSYEKDWKNINSNLSGLDLQKLTTWSYVWDGWQKMKCLQNAWIKSTSSRKHFLTQIFWKNFEQKKSKDKKFWVFYNDIILKSPSNQVACKVWNKTLTYNDLKNITRYVELVESIK